MVKATSSDIQERDIRNTANILYMASKYRDLKYRDCSQLVRKSVAVLHCGGSIFQVFRYFIEASAVKNVRNCHKEDFLSLLRCKSHLWQLFAHVFWSKVFKCGFSVPPSDLFATCTFTSKRLDLLLEGTARIYTSNSWLLSRHSNPPSCYQLHQWEPGGNRIILTKLLHCRKLPRRWTIQYPSGDFGLQTP